MANGDILVLLWTMERPKISMHLIVLRAERQEKAAGAFSVQPPPHEAKNKHKESVQ